MRGTTVTASAYSGGTVGVSRLTRSLRPRPPIWWGFISPRPIRPWCCVWRRSLRFRLWSVLRDTCGFPMVKPSKGFNHEYERHGTITLFAALNVATGQVKAGPHPRRRHREFLDFMNEVVADYPRQEIHVVLDHLSSHKPQRDRWRNRHPHVHWHYTPTHASWLNQMEIWFSILTRQALRGASFTSPRQVREAIDRFLAAYNAQAAPFEWRKSVVRNVGLKQYYGHLRH